MTASVNRESFPNENVLFIVSKRVSFVRAGSSQFYGTFLVFNRSSRWTDRQTEEGGGEMLLGVYKASYAKYTRTCTTNASPIPMQIRRGHALTGPDADDDAATDRPQLSPQPPRECPAALLQLPPHGKTNPSVVIIPTTSTQLANASDAESKSESESDSKSGICADCDDNWWLE